MSFYEGLSFFICLFLFLIPAVILGIMEKKMGHYTLAVSLVFIVLVFGHSPGQFLYLLLFYGWSYLVVRGYAAVRAKNGRNEKQYYLFLAAMLLPLILCKLSPLFHMNIFGFTGISYMSFRSIQMVIEIYDGIILEVPLLEFSGFLLFFPSISSGPIDRSRRFHDDWMRILPRAEYLDMLAEGIFKLLLGLVYKLALGTQLYTLLTICEQSMGRRDAPWYFAAGYAWLYGFYLFFDFAGYSLMAVGTAYILGVRLPDNFRAPFRSLDIKEFWDRWHITLSHWFRDFLFTRFIMKCSKKKWFSTRLNRACAGFIVNLGVMGLWHGVTPSYILYGLYHGILLSATEVYQKKSGFYKKYKNRKLYKAVSWLLTINLVIFGFFIFSGKFLELLTA